MSTAFDINYAHAYGIESLAIGPSYSQRKSIVSQSEIKVKTFGQSHGAYLLCLIAVLLLVRETFTAATSWDAKKQNNEHLWYPLYALPELLAVIIYAAPSLVPPRSELPK